MPHKGRKYTGTLASSKGHTFQALGTSKHGTVPQAGRRAEAAHYKHHSPATKEYYRSSGSEKQEVHNS